GLAGEDRQVRGDAVGLVPVGQVPLTKAVDGVMAGHDAAVVGATALEFLGGELRPVLPVPGDGRVLVGEPLEVVDGHPGEELALMLAKADHALGWDLGGGHAAASLSNSAIRSLSSSILSSRSSAWS